MQPPKRHYGWPRPGSSLLNDSSQLPKPHEFSQLNTILPQATICALATLLNAENQPPKTDETTYAGTDVEPPPRVKGKLLRDKCFEVSNIQGGGKAVVGT